MFHHDLARLAAETPDAIVAIQQNRHITLRELVEQASGLAHWLRQCGIKPGDRIAILAKNSIEYLAFLTGASAAAAVTVPLNYRLAPPELAFILNDSGARIIFASGEFTPVVESIRGELPTVERFVTIAGACPAGWESFSACAQMAPIADAARDGDRDAFLMYTSGTTGAPKGVIVTHAGFNALSKACNTLFRMKPGERWLMALPMYHIFGIANTIACTAWRGCLYILEEFKAADTVRILDEQAIQVAPLVPAMILACVQAPGAAARDYKALRAVGYGASPISEKTLRAAMDVFRCDFIQLYGMTELAPITVLTEEEHRRGRDEKPSLLLSAGRVPPGVEMRIVDSNDLPLPAGAVGEIVARGPIGMRGYWNRPEATAEAMRDGWMHTGDAGYIDEEGYLYIQDRVKDMIVSGGENIYPREVEEALSQMSEIVDVAVIGIPDEKWGEALKAFVVLTAGAQATEQEVIDFCRTRLAGYKRPRSVDFVTALPRNPSGKVLKRQLREPYWKGRDRRVSGV